MLVGTFITDSNGVETFVANDSIGFYLAKDAEVMVKVLDKKYNHLTATTIGGEQYRNMVDSDEKS